MSKLAITKRALRKLKRRSRDDAQAKQARFWVGRIKSADRMLYDRPINRQAKRILE